MNLCNDVGPEQSDPHKFCALKRGQAVTTNQDLAQRKQLTVDMYHRVAVFDDAMMLVSIVTCRQLFINQSVCLRVKGCHG